MIPAPGRPGSKIIRKVKGGFRLVSKRTGKNLGTFKTKAEAQRREQQVQFFKRQGKPAGKKKR